MSPEIVLSRDPELRGLARYHDAMTVPMRFVLYSDGRLEPLHVLTEAERAEVDAVMIEWPGD